LRSALCLLFWHEGIYYLSLLSLFISQCSLYLSSLSLSLSSFFFSHFPPFFFLYYSFFLPSLSLSIPFFLSSSLTLSFSLSSFLLHRHTLTHCRFCLNFSQFFRLIAISKHVFKESRDRSRGKPQTYLVFVATTTPPPLLLLLLILHTLKLPGLV